MGGAAGTAGTAAAVPLLREVRQASVELPSIMDDTGCGVQQTL